MLSNGSNTPAGEAPEAPSRNRGNVWILTMGIVLGLAGLGYGVHANGEAARAVESQQAAFQTTMSQMRQQMQQEVQSLHDRLAEQEAKRVEIPAAPERTRASDARPAPARRAPVQRAARPVDDPRFKQLEQKLSDHDEKLSDTQRMLESTRSDLAGQINSTSAELHGSIARTSEEVAALRRRGERDYVEFDVVKAKALRRIGPLSLALRKTDTKHKRYNVDMLVDDNRLEKKNVNLLEPVYISSPEWPQPVELVVNRVDKDRIKGYISTPKYKRADLAAPSAEAPTNPQPEPSSIEPE